MPPYIIVALFLTALFAQTISANDSTISSNTSWSGHVTLEGNVTIAQGTTLTIAAGTTIDGGDGYMIEVEGVLNAQQSHFYSNTMPTSQSSHGQGLWQGIVVSSTGIVTLTDVLIENTNVGVKSQGEINIQNLTVVDSYLGINNMGIGQVDQFSTTAIDYQAIINSGQISVSQANITNSGTGLLSTGNAVITNSNFSNVGLAISATAGDLIANNINFATVSVGFATSNGASTDVTYVEGTNVSLLVDQSNADDFQLQYAMVSGDRLSKSSGATNTIIADINFSSNMDNQKPVVDHNCEGVCQLNNITIISAQKAILFSGIGTHIVNNSNITAQNYALKSTGAGQLIAENSTFNSIQDGLLVRETNSNFIGQISINTFEQESIGLDVLSGVHHWQEVTISKNYDPQDTKSIGSQIWYASVTVEHLQTNNYSTGAKVRYGNLEAESISNHGGKEIAISLISSILEAENLQTKFQNIGVLMTKHSQMSVYQWVAELHYEPLRLADDSIANILYFTTINTDPTSADAIGNGILNYGSNQSLVISTTEQSLFQYTNIAIHDMSNSPVQATLIVNTFQFATGQNGQVLIPLFPEGSLVSVNVLGTGTSKILYGGLANQIIQVPVIPNGDWTISSNDVITLESDTGVQLINGNIILNDDATLIIYNTELIIGEGKTITLNDQSQIIGYNAIIQSSHISINNLAKISASDQQSQLTLNADILWNCVSPSSTYNLILNGDISLSSQCELTISNGEVNAEIFVDLDSSLNVTSTLSISVINQGIPIQGATIDYQGIVTLTDQQGRADISAISRYVTWGEDVNGSQVDIQLTYGEFTHFTTWDTSTSKQEQIIISVIDEELIQSNSVVLEKIWSPYYLDFDLTIPVGSTLTISDGVSLRISNQVEIIVEGALISGTGTFSSTGFGNRWGGLILGSSPFSTIQLSGTSVFEASPAVTVNSGGEFHADYSYFARSLPTDPLINILTNSAALVELHNSQLADGGASCIEAGASSTNLKILNVSMERCNGPALRAENIELEIKNISVGAGSSHGLVLSSVTGNLSGLLGIDFDGSGNLLKLNYIDDLFTVQNVIGKTGQSAAIAGANNRALNLHSIEITGAPGIDFDTSAGILTNIILHGQGTGAGLISHHGRYAQNLELNNLQISGYNVGIDLHADGVESVSTLEIYDSTINATTAISNEEYPFSIFNSNLAGVIELSGPAKFKFFDVNISSNETILLWNGAEIEIYHSTTLISIISDIMIYGEYYVELYYSNNSQSTLNLSGEEVLFYAKSSVKAADSINSIVLQNMTITAKSSGYAPQTIFVDLQILTSKSSEILFQLQYNLPPTILNTYPNSSTMIMQNKELNFEITAIDEFDTANQMLFTWKIYDNNGVLIYNFTSSNKQNILAINNPGNHLLSFGVTDSLGAYSEVLVPVEVQLLDSDGDFSDTCNQQTWFDASISRSCGPDVYDDDDDNDGYVDSRDAWPTDPCAWQDSDYDNQPDTLNCPDGFTTDLYEDQDDDGDGIPDILEEKSSSSNEQFSSVTLILIVVGIIGIALFFIRLRKGNGSDIDDRD